MDLQGNPRRPASDRQLQAAIAAAPYVHPKLAAVAVQDVTPPDPALEERRRAARQQLMAALFNLAKPEPLTIQGKSETPAVALSRSPPMMFEG